MTCAIFEAYLSIASLTLLFHAACTWLKITIISQLLADGIFFLFATVFGYTRLYLYPKYMVYNTWQAEELDIVSRSFFCVMFFTLLVLHVFW